jgi:hypothetical protein
VTPEHARHQQFRIESRRFATRTSEDAPSTRREAKGASAAVTSDALRGWT